MKFILKMAGWGLAASLAVSSSTALAGLFDEEIRYPWQLIRITDAVDYKVSVDEFTAALEEALKSPETVAAMEGMDFQIGKTSFADKTIPLNASAIKFSGAGLGWMSGMGVQPSGILDKMVAVVVDPLAERMNENFMNVECEDASAKVVFFPRKEKEVEDTKVGKILVGAICLFPFEKGIRMETAFKGYVSVYRNKTVLSLFKADAASFLEVHKKALDDMAVALVAALMAGIKEKQADALYIDDPTKVKSTKFIGDEIR